MPILEFPAGFLWGAATSSHQVEGGLRNNWTEWEAQNAERLARESRTRFGALPVWKSVATTAESPLNYRSGDACDHYRRFREDFDLARSLHHNAHRFSIEWSRIEPEEGHFDEGAIAHYQSVIDALHERGMEPFVTLWHWTHPVWLEEQGGVESRTFPDRFERYARFVVGRLRGVRFWMTLNEPTSVIGNGYLRGIWPPQKKNLAAALRVYFRLASAHRHAFHAIHALQKDAQVGFGNIMHSFEPYHRYTFLDTLGIAVDKFLTNRFMLYLTSGHHDYLAVQYYFHDRIKFVRRVPAGAMAKSDLGWNIYPKGLYNVIDYLKRYELPIYVTENGLADGDDRLRKTFIAEHLRWLHRAIEEGADVRGYFHWSLLDNFEWDKGFWPRFGLVRVDFATQERTIRESARFYATIAERNALEIRRDPAA
jgi:beta-glucosidase